MNSVDAQDAFREELESYLNSVGKVVVDSDTSSRTDAWEYCIVVLDCISKRNYSELCDEYIKYIRHYITEHRYSLEGCGSHIVPSQNSIVIYIVVGRNPIPTFSNCLINE